MSYNRLDPTTPSYYSNDPMDQGQYRTPSPGHPLQQGYGHDPYGSHSQPGLEMPPLPPGSDQRPSPGRFGTPDQLQMNAPNSVSDLSRPDGGSYFNTSNPQPADYAFNPQAHLDAYPNQPYQPSPQINFQPSPQFSQEGLDSSGYDYDDRRPMLAGSDSSEQYRDELTPRPQPQPQQAGGQQQQPQQPGNGSSVGVRRWKTVKQVLLYRGNLVLDCPVPPRLLGQVPHTERDEFTHMRYSAATCDPSDFVDDNFTLRQKLFSKPRQTELFIVVTMYNEEETLLGRTLMGVFKNIEYMCRRTESKTWGKDAWKKIVVCVVSDGRSKINPRSRALLAGLGVYQEGIAKQKVNDKDVTAHIYEYTTQMGLFEKSGVIGLTPKQQPVQMLFCLKEKNQKKINSHRWFFQAFGAVLEPNICVLIDAGTRPGGNSIYHLWKAFDLEPTCAGACGEIKAMLGTGGKYLFNPLVATQNFEYKMSNILDKPLESAFGFISVLPGAFSAYRYVALQNDKDNKGPLEKYFTGETLHGSNAGVFTSNMYLAEDRILCFELVTKRNCHWILQYVKSATGETDVPNTVTELILQRRRWLNGSFFAAIYAIAHFHQFFRSDHSLLRKLMFFLEFVFSTINMIFSWFAIGNFFLVFKILTTSLSDPTLLGITGKILGIVFSWLYGACLLTCFVLSLGNRPAGTRLLYTLMVYFWAIIMVYLMFAAVFISVEAIISDVHDANGFSVADLFKNPIFYTLIVSVLSTYGIWFIASLIMFDPWHMFTSFIQYMLLTPTYVNILNVYAFCNTHDVTWGTKGDDRPDKLPSVSTKDGAGKTDLPDSTDLDAQYERELAEFRQKEVKIVTARTPVQEQEDQLDYYRNFRSIVVLVWLVTNFALVALVLNAAGVERITPDASSSNQKENLYMTIVLWSVAGLSAFKFIGAMWFLVVRIFRGV